MSQDDVRQRRAERVRADKFKNFLPQYGKYIAIALVVIVAGAAVATFYHPAPGKKFAHEHPAFTIFADGQQVTYNDPAYDASKINDKVHIHYNGELQKASTWHVEAMFPGGIPDISLHDILALYGTQFNKGSLRLDSNDGHRGESWADGGNKTWRVFVSKHPKDAEAQPFVELTAGSALLPEGAARTNGDYTAYAPRDLDKILLTYGADDALIAQQQAQVPEPKP